jgi:hypothetical protein
MKRHRSEFDWWLFAVAVAGAAAMWVMFQG